MTARRMLLAAILLTCVVARGAYALHLAHSDPAVTTEGDTRSYLQPARELYRNGSFDNGQVPNRPEFLRTPGYPTFIAGVFHLFGDDTTAVLLAQVVVSALTVLVVYLLAARMWSERVAIVAAAFTLIEPLQNYTSATLVTEALEAFLLAVFVAIGFVALSRERLRAWQFAVLGFALACAMYVRPVVYYLPLLVIALVALRWWRRRDAWLDVVRAAAAFLVPILVMVGGWQLRNHERVDSWRFSGIESKNLYLFRAAGVVARRDGIAFNVAQHRLRLEFGRLGNAAQGPYYGRMYRQGMHILTSHPLDTAALTFRGFLSELFSVRLKVFLYLGLAPASGPVEIFALALLLGFYAVCIYGIVVVLRSRSARIAHALAIAVAAYVLVASAGPEAFGGRGERFRAPILPILILYGAYGSCELWSRARGRRNVGTG